MVEHVSYPAALLAGLVSFFSPCILPLIPAYFTFITGMSFDEMTAAGSAAVRARVVRATCGYVLGFSIVFIALGVSATLVGGLVFQYRSVIRIGGGLLIIVLGLHVMGLWRIRWLDFEKRVSLKTKPLHFLGTVVIGMAFAAGWSPCVGPLLGAILILAGNQQSVVQGAGLLAVYSAGLAVPFLVLAFCTHYLVALVRKMTRIMRYVNMAAGGLLVAMGILLVADKLYLLNI